MAADQLSMLDALCPPPAPAPYAGPVTREVMTRAYGRDYLMRIREDDPDPVEIEVDGTPCLITFGYGFSTYTVQPAGSLFWSESGFRSFSHGALVDGEMVFVRDMDSIIYLIRAHVAAPIKDMGLGGKLVRWWPPYVRQWQSDTSWALTYDRAEMWTQWGPERHAEIWAEHDARRAAAVTQMWAEGIDPNDVGKPAHHKGSWPKIERPQA